MNQKKVLTAISGGVDSALASATLKEKGYCVVGVFLRLHSNYKKAEERAKAIAERLNIDFCVFDYRKEFKGKVVDHFIKSSKKGLTPNPCVVCNKEIKFGLLFESLARFKADYIATGHYVKLKNGRLFMAEDKDKDQSYFLWKLNQKILKKTIFLHGDSIKKNVKKAAEKLELPVLEEESQELCFVEDSLKDFFRINLKPKPGNIIEKGGGVIGRHEGLWHYTIGQRKGIELGGGPYYVLAKDAKKNNLIVTKNQKDLFGKELNFKEPNWISGKKPGFPLRVSAKIRLHHKPALAVVDRKNHLIFDEPQKAITPGQSAVFYSGKKLLGGGIIE